MKGRVPGLRERLNTGLETWVIHMVDDTKNTGALMRTPATAQPAPLSVAITIIAIACAVAVIVGFSRRF